MALRPGLTAGLPFSLSVARIVREGLGPSPTVRETARRRRSPARVRSFSTIAFDWDGGGTAR